jgi:1,4-dihydroxy-2-naphthoyl-CoA hydrolase
MRPFRLPAFAQHIGLEVLDATTERVIGRVALGPEHSNGRGQAHGGLIMAMADTLGAIATVVNLPPETMTTTIESKTNFLAAARGEYLIGESLPLHIGRTTMVWQTTIRDANDRRVAVVTQTQLVLPARAGNTSGSAPVEIADER